MAELIDKPSAPEPAGAEAAGPGGAPPEAAPLAAGKACPPLGMGPGRAEADAPTPTRPFWIWGTVLTFLAFAL